MTLPPLLIAAENGDLLFYSGVRRRDACFAAIRTACAAQPRGILKIGDTRAYAKRQRTWFRARSEARFFAPQDLDGLLAAARQAC